MTADGLAGERQVSVSRAQAGAAALSPTAILSLCDRLLGEVGRRRHMFGWLRPNGAAPGSWLEIDAYYPGHRLVVAFGTEDGPNAQILRALVPQHGLRLLYVAPEDLGSSVEEVESALNRLLATLPSGSEAARSRPAVRSRAPAPVPRGSVSVAGGSAAVAGPVVAAGIAAPGRAGTASAGGAARSPSELQTLGVLAGVALACLVCTEAYLGVARAALHSGRVLLGLAIVLDACARALGTLAAERAGSADWAWACVIFGSPAAAGFALAHGPDGNSAEAAPLAGAVGACAIVLLIAALLLGV